MEKYSPCKQNRKKAGVAVLTSDKTDFKTRLQQKTKGALHNDKGVSPRRDITLINIYAPNTGSPNI